MYNSELLKTPPKGIHVKQAADHVSITVDGNFSAYSFYGLLIFGISVFVGYIILTSKGNSPMTVIFTCVFLIIGAVMLFFDFRTKTTTTHITINSQNHIDISTHRNEKNIQSTTLDHIEEINYQELMLYRDGLIRTAPVHRIIPIITDGQNTFTMPKIPKAKWEWLKSLFSELLDLYEAQVAPEISASEEATKRALLEEEEE